jgi:putative SOS response-associated peptidase YedK
MCGRFVRQSDIAVYAEMLQAEVRHDPGSSYNIAPTQNILAARIGNAGERELVSLRWSLVPAWSKGPDNRYSMINARAETVASKPAYRKAFRQRRCLIPADGFYEWQKQSQARARQPYYIHLIDHQPFVMAGVWEYWRSETDEVIESCAIITTTANDRVAAIHDRMPVILAPGDYAQWLDPHMRDVQTLSALLRPFPTERMAAYPVSTLVNNPANNSAQCLQPTA